MLTELRGFDPPLYPGAVVLAGQDGRVVVHEAMGYALRYADAEGTELPPEQQVPMRPDTIFDLASVTKLFTSIVVMRQVERGRVDLDAPAASYLPEFAAGGKESVTVRRLLTHTSGLPPWLPLWRDLPDRESRIRAAVEVTPVAPPGTGFTYSDLNLIALGVLAERVSGRPLDTLVRDGITGPLAMNDTGYHPPATKLERIAATEYQSNPPRGMVRGTVHDENAWSLGGVAGHAGIFSTAADLARLCRALLGGGAYDSGTSAGQASKGGAFDGGPDERGPDERGPDERGPDEGGRILEPGTVEQMLTDFNAAFPGHAHGLGFELGQRWYMGGLSSPRTAGHTGFTGTSLVIEPLSRTYAILLTNRVHPSRSWSGANAARRVVGNRLARALSVTGGRGLGWYAGRTGDSAATLTLPVTLRSDRTSLVFDLFTGAETSDLLVVELSRDNGQRWEPVPLACRSRGTVAASDGPIAEFAGRRWQQASAELAEAPGDVLLRWRYAPDPAFEGPGARIDDVRLADSDGLLLDAGGEPERFRAVGWVRPARCPT